MGVIKDYFKLQLKWNMLLLKHENASDFYLSAFQKNRSAVPLLFLRAIICLGCIAIWITSAVLDMAPFGYWPIFLTHWGLVLNTIAAAFGVIVSARAYLRGPIDGLFGLPWYVRMYWAMTNISTTIAFFITVFYWSFLSADGEILLDQEYAVNETVDILTHVLNIILMLMLLMSAKQPLRLLHVYQPVTVAIIYLAFTLIYYYAGGTHPWSEGAYIYPPLDWSMPGTAVVTVVLSLVLLTVLHAVCALLVVARDVLSRRLLRDNVYTVSVGNYDHFSSTKSVY